MSTDIHKKLTALLKENGVKLGYSIEFPMYRQLPDEVVLAIKILERHGMRVHIVIEKDK